MRLIELTRGQFAQVDDEDFDALNEYFWHAKWNNSTKSYYAARPRRKADGPGSLKVYMHRQVLGIHNNPVRTKDGWQEVDHINHNTVDNRKENLRIVDRRGQALNRRKKVGENGKVGYFKGQVGYSGARWDAGRGEFV